MRPPQWFKRVAVPLANRIVYASDAYAELKSTLIDLSPQLVDFERISGDPADLRLLEFARLIRPMSGPALRKVRVGCANDGGYVMADTFDVLGAISVGIGTNVSWDQAIAGRQIPVFMFDPTIRRLPERVVGGQFFRMGLGNSDASGLYAPLSTLVERAQLANVEPLILKIDIEGSEYDSLLTVSDAQLSRFQQIVIEFHDLTNLHSSVKGKSIIHLAKQLSRQHFPIHVHGNNYDSLVRFGTTWFPNAIEVSYLHKSLLESAKPADRIVSKYDYPCDPRVVDFCLESLCTISGLRDSG